MPLYHENRNTGKMVQCASDPCRLHSDDEHVRARNSEEAQAERARRDYNGEAQGLNIFNRVQDYFVDNELQDFINGAREQAKNKSQFSSKRSAEQDILFIQERELTREDYDSLYHMFNNPLTQHALLKYGRHLSPELVREAMNSDDWETINAVSSNKYLSDEQLDYIAHKGDYSDDLRSVDDNSSMREHVARNVASNPNTAKATVLYLMKNARNVTDGTVKGAHKIYRDVAMRDSIRDEEANYLIKACNKPETLWRLVSKNGKNLHTEELKTLARKMYNSNYRSTEDRDYAYMVVQDCLKEYERRNPRMGYDSSRTLLGLGDDEGVKNYA